MAKDAVFQMQIQRIGELVEQLETRSDPSARALAKELLETLMELHGAALERILELASEAGEPGDGIIRKCGNDELVSSVLLLYGLHPEGLQTRVTRALQKTRTYLESHAAKADLISISDTGTVTLRLEVKSAGCGSAAATVKSTLEAAVQNAAPDAAAIIVEESGTSLTQSGFVSVAQLESGKSMTNLYAVRAERGGD